MLMRRLFIFSILLTACMFTGCENWLNVKPQNEQANDEFWNNKEEVEAVVNGCYQQLRTCLQYMVKWGELRGDVVELGPGLNSDQDMLNVKNIEIKPDNSICNWQPFYNAINRCNAVITCAEGVLEKDNTFSEKACAAYIAEAKWIRALSYFYLVRTFCDVPYITQPYLDDQVKFEVPKSEGYEVLRTLATDLEECMSDLPFTYGVGSWENKGRATIWAAYALLADMYLWIEDYQKCIDMCNRLEQSMYFLLVPNEDWYSIYYPGNSAEGIFELQWSVDYEQTNNLFAWFYNENSNNSYAVSDAAVARFSEYPGEDDVRGTGGSFIEASSKIWKYAGTARGVDNLRATSNRDANWIIYRYADIILMHAEALVMSDVENDFAQAYDYVVQVRERAGYVTHPLMPTSQYEAADMILDERMRELCFEGKRWFDLVRMAVRNNGERKDKLISLLLLNVAAKDRPLFESKLQNIYGYYLPINESDIDSSGGLLIQNPYYL